MASALAPGAATVHDDVPGNICYDWHIGDKAVVDGVFANAHKIVRLDLTNNRLIPNAMEPRAAIGDYDVNSGEYTLHTTSQNPHVIRLLDGRVRAAHPPRKQAGVSSLLTSAVVSVPKSIITPKKQSSPGPPPKSAVP